ncbi:MAG: hypothetical protein QW273_00005, partial [Candidatus Pacearchaeota archaeon]
FKIPFFNLKREKEENKTEIFPIEENKTEEEIEIYINSTQIFLEENEEKNITFEIKNKKNKSVEILLEGKKEIKVKIEPLETKNVTINFYFEKKGFFNESIMIKWDNSSKDFTFYFYVLEKNRGENQSYPSLIKEDCIGGEICKEGEDCIGGEMYIILNKGFCCIGGECKKIEEKKKDPKKYVIGITIFLLLGILFYMMWKKTKSVKVEPKF